MRSGHDLRAGQGDGAAPEPAYDPHAYRHPEPSAPRAAPDYGDPQRGYSDPRYHDPRQVDPRQVDPRAAHSRDSRQAGDLHADPGYADPRYTDPRYTDPRYADPGHADPSYSDPRDASPRYGDPRGYGDGRGYVEPSYGDESGDGPYARRDPHLPEDRPFPADGRGYDETGLSDYDPGGLGGERDYEADEGPDDGEAEEHAAPRRSRLATVLAVVGLALVGTAAAVGYRAVVSGRSGPAPVIRADNTPNKVVPAQNGDGGSGKQIYDRLADHSQEERVVPREEQPVDLQDATRAASPRMAVPNVGTPAITAPALASQQQSTAGFGPASANGSQEPRKIRTVTIRPDEGTEPTTRAAARPGAPAPIVAPPSGSGPGPRQMARAQDSGGPLSLTPNGFASPAAAAPAAPVMTRTAVATPGAAQPVAPAAGSGYVVQVLAQSSEAEAQSSFRKMQARFPNQLGGLEPIIRRKEVGGGVKYGAQVGPYASREDAVKLCEDLKAAGGSCFVAKN